MNPLKPGVWFYNDYIFPYEPFYIGKGKNKRMHSHVYDASRTKQRSHKLNTIRKILKEGQSPIVGRITEFLCEEEAFFIEEDLIRVLTSSYKCLTNIQTGGLPGSTIINSSCGNKTKAKISSNRKEKFKSGELVVWNKGLTKESDPRVHKLADHLKEIKSNGGSLSGKDHWNYGNTTKIESRIKTSETLSGVHVDMDKIVKLRFEGKSSKQIALALNCSTDVILTRLKWLNLKSQGILKKIRKGEYTYEQFIHSTFLP